MDWLIAAAHIFGALLTVSLLNVVSIFVLSWETDRNRKRELDETAIKLGVAPDQLEREDMTPKIIQLASDRFSSDLLSNRVSDLCGVLRTCWGWLGVALQVGIFISVLWFTASEGKNNAVGAWLMVATSIFFWLSSVAFSLACRLLTGRYPGQAKEARKSLTAFLKQNASVNT